MHRARRGSFHGDRHGVFDASRLHGTFSRLRGAVAELSPLVIAPAEDVASVCDRAYVVLADRDVPDALSGKDRPCPQLQPRGVEVELCNAALSPADKLAPRLDGARLLFCRGDEYDGRGPDDRPLEPAVIISERRSLAQSVGPLGVVDLECNGVLQLLSIFGRS